MALAALIVSVIALGWQVVSWAASRTPQARLSIQFGRATTERRGLITYDDAGTASMHASSGSGRLAVVLQVWNTGINPFEVVTVAFRAEGSDEGLGVTSLPVPDASSGLNPTIPGLVSGHSQGVVWAYAEDLEGAFGADPRIYAEVTLGNGARRRSQAIDLTHADPLEN